jgi:WS/DGAT/MGAT family acyltransferase
MHFARVLGRTMPALGRVQSQLRRRQLKLPSMSAPRTRFNGNVTAHRVVEGRRFSLADARKAKSAVEGATINDLVLSVVGGALRAYLDAKGELPIESLSAMAPISVRSEDQKGTAGNQVSGMIVSLASNIADPLDRLVAVRQSTHQSKEFSQAVGARTLSDYSQFIPGGLAGLAARTASRFSVAQRANPVVNTTVTNVPGPREPLYFAGARMVTLVGMGPVTDGMGLIHPITSYCDELVIAATSCREMMPDPGFYADCIEGAWNDLMKATT